MRNCCDVFRTLCLSTAALLVSYSSSLHLQADDGVSEANRHIAAGEFGLARKNALAPEDAPVSVAANDQVLAQIATQQFASGDPVAAGNTIRSIASPPQRQQAMNGARGGAAFADFDSLMQLIQTTVVPDTWEALGGPSTMAPYAQGVYVDPQGTVLPCETVASTDPLASLNSVLAAKAPLGNLPAGDWMAPAKLRYISLRRLRDAIADRQIAGLPLDDAIRHCAGISRIQYLMFVEDDIVVGGPVGGIQQTAGWYIDQQTGDSPIRSDFLFTCLASAKINQAFGCTIDPTPQGLQNAAAVATRIKTDEIPLGKAAAEMSRALGMQRVEVFGTPGDTAIGYLMVEADRHMKELALGKEEMPDSVKNYLDMIDATIANGPPDQLLLRLWFTSLPQKVRANAERTVFEIGGDSIQLSGQNQRALATGARGQVTVDPRTEMFVQEFNRNFHAIRDKYPIYGSLQSIYRAAAIAELMDSHVSDPRARMLVDSLAAQASAMDYGLVTPKQVQSIATLHKVRHGRTIHNVLLASGGVAVDPTQTMDSNIGTYETLTSLRRSVEDAPVVIQNWWWDAN